MSVLPNELKTFEYYKQKLPIYLQNSNGFQEHFRLWYDLMMGDSSETINGIVPSCDELLELLNIFSKEYGQASTDILDKIGSLFGVTRHFPISYTYNGSTTGISDVNLNDSDFAVLIRSRIVRNACDGTREQIQQFYEEIFKMSEDDKSKQVIMTTSPPGKCILYLVYVEKQDTLTMLEKLFLAGKLRIESMGIQYEELIAYVDTLLIFDSIVSKHVWDTGVWL